MDKWISVGAPVVSVVSAGIAIWSVVYARRSANASVQSAEAATRSADLAEVVERGRQHGWRIEASPNGSGEHVYTLRNVGTVDARDVSLAGQYFRIGFIRAAHDDRGQVAIPAGQARLFRALQAYSDRGGEVHITWTPDLPAAVPMTWTEVPPMAPNAPPREGS